MGNLYIMSIVVLLILGIIVCLNVFLSIFAYKKGLASGNATVSLVIIIFGLMLGFIIPGLFHLVGTSRNKLKQEKRILEVEKLRAELEYYQRKLKSVE